MAYKVTNVSSDTKPATVCPEFHEDFYSNDIRAGTAWRHACRAGDVIGHTSSVGRPLVLPAGSDSDPDKLRSPKVVRVRLWEHLRTML